MKRLLVQRHAMRDLFDARAYFRREAPHVVGDFALAVDTELLHLRPNPSTRSPRYALQLRFT